MLVSQSSCMDKLIETFGMALPNLYYAPGRMCFVSQSSCMDKLIETFGMALPNL